MALRSALGCGHPDFVDEGAGRRGAPDDSSALDSRRLHPYPPHRFPPHASHSFRDSDVTVCTGTPEDGRSRAVPHSNQRDEARSRESDLGRCSRCSTSARRRTTLRRDSRPAATRSTAGALCWRCLHRCSPWCARAPSTSATVANLGKLARDEEFAAAVLTEIRAFASNVLSPPRRRCRRRSSRRSEVPARQRHGSDVPLPAENNRVPLGARA